MCGKQGWIGEIQGSQWSEFGKEGKQHDNADVTFRIGPTTEENWQTHDALSESVYS